MNWTERRRKLLACLQNGWTIRSHINVVGPGQMKFRTLSNNQFTVEPPPDVDAFPFGINNSELNVLHANRILRKFRRGGVPYYVLSEAWESE